MDVHCMKSVRIQSFSGPYFHAFRPNTDQKNSKYGYILSSGLITYISGMYIFLKIHEYAKT